jgi:glycosyltransferase involved in cell wall biosynthesis
VTIGLPVYNSARHLDETIESLISQTLDDFELIVSDNASTDETGAICMRYAKFDPRVQYLRQRINVGAPRNWNAVFHPARGRYFKWASGNDVCDTTLLEKCVAALERDAGAVLCYGRTQFVDDTGAPTEIYDGDLPVSDERPGKRFESVRREWVLNNAQQGVIRTEILRQTGLDRLFPNGDLSLMAELALYGRFILLPDILLRRRWTPESMMNMRTPAEIHRLYNPQARRPMRLVVGRQQWDQFSSIARAPIPPVDKVHAWVAALQLTVGAWRFLLREILWPLRPPVSYVLRRLRRLRSTRTIGCRPSAD